MSAYQEILRLAEAQAAALTRGDLEAAVGLLEARGALLARAGAPGRADLDAIREVLRLDGELSSAIRERMIRLRQEALETQRGQRALAGYSGWTAAAAPPIVDTAT
jgi:hypothetical protein